MASRHCLSSLIHWEPTFPLSGGSPCLEDSSTCMAFISSSKLSDGVGACFFMSYLDLFFSVTLSSSYVIMAWRLSIVRFCSVSSSYRHIHCDFWIFLVQDPPFVTGTGPFESLYSCSNNDICASGAMSVLRRHCSDEFFLGTMADNLFLTPLIVKMTPQILRKESLGATRGDGWPVGSHPIMTLGICCCWPSSTRGGEEHDIISFGCHFGSAPTLMKVSQVSRCVCASCTNCWRMQLLTEAGKTQASEVQAQATDGTT